MHFPASPPFPADLPRTPATVPRELFCRRAPHAFTLPHLGSRCSLCLECLFPAPSSPTRQISAAFFKAKVTFFLKSSLTLWAELIAPRSPPAQPFTADLYYSTATRAWDNLLICLCSQTVSSWRAEIPAQIHFYFIPTQGCTRPVLTETCAELL